MRANVRRNRTRAREHDRCPRRRWNHEPATRDHRWRPRTHPAPIRAGRCGAPTVRAHRRVAGRCFPHSRSRSWSERRAAPCTRNSCCVESWLFPPITMAGIESTTQYPARAGRRFMVTCTPALSRTSTAALSEPRAQAASTTIAASTGSTRQLGGGLEDVLLTKCQTRYSNTPCRDTIVRSFCMVWQPAMGRATTRKFLEDHGENANIILASARAPGPEPSTSALPSTGTFPFPRPLNVRPPMSANIPVPATPSTPHATAPRYSPAP